MKNFALLFILILIFSCQKEPKGNMIVNGTIKGLKKGTIYLQKVSDSSLVSVDSVTLYGKETFTLSDNIESPEMYFLTLNGNVSDKRILFFGEKGEIKITDYLEGFGLNPDIQGSKNQVVLNEYKKTMIQFQNKQLDLLKADFDAQKNKDSQKSDSLKKVSEELMRKQYLYSTNFALSKTDSEVAPYIALTDLVNANVKLLDTIYVSLSEDIKSSLYGKKLNDFIQEIKENEK